MSPENPKKVAIETLGICEHCEKILSAQDMPVEAMDAEWRCPSCEQVLTGTTFGYERDPSGHFVKSVWVGPDRKWVKERPVEDFEVGNFKVIIPESHELRVWVL